MHHQHYKPTTPQLALFFHFHFHSLLHRTKPCFLIFIFSLLTPILVPDILLLFFWNLLLIWPLFCSSTGLLHTTCLIKVPREKKGLGSMDLLGSECSSGCESGWTLYFEQSFLSHGGSDHRETGFCDGYWKAKPTEEEEEEEDLSMVSDASSGPPHLFEDEACSHEDDGHFSLATKSATLGKRKGKKQQIKEYQCHYDQPSSFLDDTASSPAHNFTANNFSNQTSMESFLGFSQSSHFEERSAFTDHFGFLQSSLSGNRLQKNQWFEGKGIGMR